MSERNDLLASIARTSSDYRAGDLDVPTSDHVDRWVRQFSAPVRLPLLRELDHVLKRTYLSKADVEAFLRKVIKSSKLAGADPCAFWASANFLKIQSSGHSQLEMLEIVDSILQDECGIGVEACGSVDGDYIYVDDVLFSGGRVGSDVEEWVTHKAPQKATLHVIVAAIHTGGEYLVGKRLTQAVKHSGKQIKIEYWRIATIENRKLYRDDSEVLWPAEIPLYSDVQDYIALPSKFPLELRKTGGKLGPFSSEAGRQLLESELLVAGVKIRNLSKSPKAILRPLGFSPFGVGFGSMTITYRNCPNNCPLALWWGDPSATSGPFHWYPLFARKTYAQSFSFDGIGN